MTTIVVIGAGVGGLATAYAAADSGHDVTVVEQDPLELPKDPDDAFLSWSRQGVPQLRHSHAFPPRLLAVLRGRAPALLRSLIAAGAREISLVDRQPRDMVGFEPEPDDWQLASIACRRTTFEWVLREALAERSVTMMRATVQGIVAGRAAVRGVRVRDGAGAPSEVLGDLVVDASGSRSALPRWLADAGLPLPQEQASPTGIIYASRFYRLRDGCPPTPVQSPLVVDGGEVAYGVYPGDDATFSATLIVRSHDRELRALLREDAFDAVAPVLPVVRDWVDPERVEPISGVNVAAAIGNRVRRLVHPGAPVTPGLVALGDAAVRSNPLYGAGCTLALLQAFALVDIIDRSPDANAIVVRFDEHLRTEIEPWHDDAVARDRARAADTAFRGHPFQRHGVAHAMGVDPHVWRAALRVTNLLDPPGAMQDPEILKRVLSAWASRGGEPDQMRSPTREELLATASARD